MPHPVDVVLDFLRAEEARGVTHVSLDDEARAVLRAVYQQSKGPRPAKPPSQPTAAVPAVDRLAAFAVEADEPPPPVVADADPAPVSMPVPTGATKAEQIASLAAQAEHWPPAFALGSLRKTMVFSTGNPEARLMLVGEAPGMHEERQREPFVGAAGEQLDKILKAMGLGRPEVYISNIVKFRPAMPNQTSNNRKPTIEEMAACLPFIRAEVEVVRPTCIVALGGTAAEGLLGLTGSVASMRGKWHDYAGIPTRVTYHPAYLLHGNASHAEKRKLWEDMLEVMAQLGMPISDKQQGFFLPKG